MPKVESSNHTHLGRQCAFYSLHTWEEPAALSLRPLHFFIIVNYATANTSCSSEIFMAMARSPKSS